MKDALLFLAENQTIIGFVLMVLTYLFANVYKYDPPKTAFGRAVMKTLSHVLFVSWRAWGFKNPRLPFQPDPEDLKALEEPSPDTVPTTPPEEPKA